MGQSVSRTFLQLITDIEVANKISRRHPDSFQCTLSFFLTRNHDVGDWPLWYIWCTIIVRKVGPRGENIGQKTLNVEEFYEIFSVFQQFDSKFIDQSSAISQSQNALQVHVFPTSLWPGFW
eukprot:TRINITY_DN5002_c0_g1_i2.p1 TRINITY_DN5002_c0_g1~~TRINITY_DN5002_c0_g1_i2.p1  ORF type:complete len:142 (-),score=22.25 TRINITY_DN5002_c0_g1_i2:65-427(-)